MMKKKVTALACAMALSISLVTPSAQASQLGGEVLPVLGVMGVMNGDARGNLNLEDDVTRAAFTKMAVAASVYKDSATSSSYVSPFADVKYTHWSAGYVKTGVDAGWINGYLDGTFRPNNSVKLEEAVNICLKMLGYTDADFANGSFPHPQLAMYANKKMNLNITAKRGEKLTRAECAQLIYNTLNATTKTGQIYAMTMGYNVDPSGNIDYLSVVNAEMEGPVILAGTSLKDKLGFTPAVVYRNDQESSAQSAMKNDVAYYIAKTKTVWLYHNQVTGVYENAVPNRSNPTGAVVSGMTYGFETSSAAHAMSAMGTFKPGDTVTLLLGRNNTVAAVIDPSEASSSAMYGIVMEIGTGSYMDAQGKPYTAPCLKMLGVDGTVYQYQTADNRDFSEGDLVKVSFEKGTVDVRRVRNNANDLSGRVNSDATKLGNYDFADDVKIMDYVDDAAVTVPASRLANVNLGRGDVAYYEMNSAGEIETLILKDVTGDMYTFGILVKDEEIPGMGPMGTPQASGHMYTVLTGGREVGPLVANQISFPVKEHQVVRFRMNSNGQELKQIYSMNEVDLVSAENGTAVANNGQKFNISRGVQVYVKQYHSGHGTEYYLTTLDQVNNDKYDLTGWYDRLESSGGLMRVILAEEV